MSSNSSNTTPATQPVRMRRRVWYVIAITVWTLLAFALAQAIGIVVLRGLHDAGVALDAVNPTVLTTGVNIVIYALAVLILIGAPRLVKQRTTTPSELGISQKPRWQDPLWLALGVVSYLVLTVIVTSLARVLFPAGDYTQAQEIGFTGLTHSWEYGLAFVSLVIVAPVAEEVIFRGYLFGKIQKYAASWIAVLVSAALFAVAHMQLNVSLDTFALGIVLALLRVKTGSIWMSIALHALKNGVAFYLLFVNPLVL